MRSVLANTSSLLEDREEAGTGPGGRWRFWDMQLDLAEKEDYDFIRRGRRIVLRYRDERDANQGRQSKYNILWANTEVLKPVLYGRPPNPDVQRRHRDTADPAASMGADILERALSWEDDVEELNDVMNQVVEDRLLPGRGTARVFYEFELGDEEDDPEAEPDEETGQQPQFQPVISERAPVRYVFWEDYRECPARTENEIWWKAYRSYLTRDELAKRFGEAKADQIQLDYLPKGTDTIEGDPQGPLADGLKKATVWEIWDKQEKRVIWHAVGYKDGPLDDAPDPLQLPGFFPSPPCLRATTTNEQRVAIADYIEYEDQAKELDTITSRIERLTRALKVSGVYAGSEKAILQQLVDDNSENRLIPVEDWAGFAGDKG